MAWFSSLTHLSALSFLRRYFHQNPAKRAWRVCLMILLLVLLVVAFLPTGYFNFRKPAYYWRPFDLGRTMVSLRYINHTRNLQTDFDRASNHTTAYYGPYSLVLSVLPSSPALCFFKFDLDAHRNDEAYLSFIFSLTLLLYSYAIRFGKLFQTPSRFMMHCLRRGIDYVHEYLLSKWEYKLQKMRPHLALILAIIFLPIQATAYHAIRTIIDLYTSMASEVSSLEVFGLAVPKAYGYLPTIDLFPRGFRCLGSPTHPRNARIFWGPG